MEKLKNHRRIISSRDIPKCMKEDEFLNLPSIRIISEMEFNVLYRFLQNSGGEGVAIIKYDNHGDDFKLWKIKIIKGINDD